MGLINVNLNNYKQTKKKLLLLYGISTKLKIKGNGIEISKS